MQRLLLFPLSLLIALGMQGCAGENNSGEPADGPDSTLTAVDTGFHPTPDRPFESDSIPPGAVLPRYVKGEFTEAKAMEVVFGLYDKDMECSHWICRPEEKSAFEAKISRDGKLYTRPSGHHNYTHKGQRYTILLTETLERTADGWESCHVCAPLLGAVLFAEFDGDWFVMALKKDLGTLGSWGKLPGHKLVMLGDGLPGVIFRYDYTSQGITEEGIQLIGLLDGGFAVLLDTETAYSNEGYYYSDYHPERAYSYQSDWRVNSTGEGYGEFVIHTTGTRPRDGSEDNDDIVPIEITRVYGFGPEGYVLQDSSSGRVM